MSERTLGVGMVGAGFIGQLAHLANLVRVPGCRVVALAELRPELRRRVASRFEIPKTYATHRDLLQDKQVEAVVVVTPRAQTGSVVLDCLEAGKHVLSEKPMAGTVEQGEWLVQAAARRGVQYVVGYMKRYDEGVQAAKVLLDGLVSSGELGPVTYARAHCFMGDSYCGADEHIVTGEEASYAEPGWPMAPPDLSPEAGREFAAYLNTFSHDTNLLRYLFGRTPSVEFARLDRADGRVCVLGFGGFAATLETGRSTVRGWDEGVEVRFADGRLRLELPPALLRNVPAKVELYRAGKTQEVLELKRGPTWSFRRQAEAFVQDVLSGRPSLSPGADALEDLRLAEAIWRAGLSRPASSPRA